MASQIKKRKIQPLTVEDKVSIIKDYNENHLTTSQLSIKYVRPMSTISTIINKKKQAEILQHYNSSTVDISNKRIRLSNYPFIE